MNHFLKFRSLVLSVMLITVSAIPVFSQQQGTDSVLWNDGWKFSRFGEMPDGSWLDEPAIKLRKWIPKGDPLLAQNNYDDSSWRSVQLPHDWGIEGPFRMDLAGNTGKLPWAGIGWYRKHFTLPPNSVDRRWFVEMDGVMSNSLVWINGHFLGFRPYGYSSFSYEMTPYLNANANNVIAVRARPEKDSSRWYPGAGIYRDVRLVSTQAVRFKQWGLYITTPKVSEQESLVQIQAEIDGVVKGAVYTAQVTLLDSQRKQIALTDKIAIAAGKGVLSTSVPNPSLWDLTNPHLYTAVVSLYQNDQLMDLREERFGIRTIEWDAKRGLLVNGKLVEIKGVCNHHDLGALGGAFFLDGARRQLEIMLDMGFNSLRTSHNPPAPGMLDLCDEMGILVMDEAFDCWEKSKRPNDYGKFFKKWHERDVRDLVKRDRNHPSIICWSAGNEIIDFWYGKPWAKTMARLRRFFNEEDPTRLVAIGCNFADKTLDKKFFNNIDLIGYNYQTGFYKKAHETIGNPIIATETSSCLSTRGEYLFPVDDNKGGGMFNFQMSSYDLYSPGWGCPPEDEFRGQDENQFVAGEYVWTGFDYLGEPTPYNNDMTIVLNTQDPQKKLELEKQLKKNGKGSPSRSSYFGILDLCGFPKDRFYSYQARWRADLPMAHLFPHWNWSGREGEITPVHCYTSGDEAELFVNGVSQGRQKKALGQYRFRWNDVVYQPGEIEVVVWKEGQKWASDRVETTDHASAIRFSAEKSEVVADGQSLVYLKAEVVDANGRMVPAAMNRLHFSVEGAAEIIAVCNGDPTSFEPFQADNMKAFNGLCQLIIRTSKVPAGAKGAIQVSVEAEGLSGDSVSIQYKR